MAKSVDPDQTAPSRTVWSGSALLHMPFCQKFWCTKFQDIYRKAKKKNSCVSGSPTDPVVLAPTVNFFSSSRKKKKKKK